jgi:hypothetical protein
MAMKNASELREAAQRYRDMCVGDGDPAFKEALMLLADEFEREAESKDTRKNSDGSGDHLAP